MYAKKVKSKSMPFSKLKPRLSLHDFHLTVCVCVVLLMKNRDGKSTSISKKARKANKKKKQKRTTAWKNSVHISNMSD